MMPSPMYPYSPPLAMPASPPEKQFPVPAARRTPFFWALTLTLLTVASITLAVIGSLTVPPAPGPRGTVVYSSTLATNDGAWKLGTTPAGQCDYAHGSLGATGSDLGYLAPVCELMQPASANLRLSVRLVPQNTFAGTQHVAIRIHGTIYIKLDGDGIVQILQKDSPSSHSLHAVFSGVCAQCHTDGSASNTVVILVDQGIYTIAINGAQLFQQQLDVPPTLPDLGDIALGTYTAPDDSSGTINEARFADLSLATF